MAGYFTKGNLIILFAVAVVLAFIVEPFAFRSGYIQSDTQEQQDNSLQAMPVIGVGEATARVSSFQNEIVITGAESAKSEIDQLRKQGVLLYTTELSGNRTALQLKQNANITQVAEALLLPEVSRSAQTQLTLPDRVYFNTTNGTVQASPGRTIYLSMDPIMDLGDEVSLTILAELLEGAVTKYEARLNMKKQAADVEAEVLTLRNEYRATIQFKETPATPDEIKTALEKFENVKLSETAQPVVVVSKQISDEEAGELNATGLVAFAYKNVIQLKTNVRKTDIEPELARILPVNTSFEYSGGAQNLTFSSSATDLSNEITDLTNAANTVVWRLAEVGFGKTLEFENTTYKMSTLTTYAYVPEKTTVGETLPVRVQVASAGHVAALTGMVP